MPNPLISVIIPSYNRADYIVEAVQSAFAQTYPALELIVIDDGSTDATAQVLAPFVGRLTYVRQENQGIGAARNHGVARSSGEFVAFLDSDDLWLPDKLQWQMAAFRNAPETDAVYGHAEQFISPELDAEAAARLRHLAGKIQPAPIACALLIRRPAFDAVGPFDPALRVGVDMDWYARLCERGLKTVMLEQTLYRRRLHRSNLNLTHAHEQSERLRVLKMALDRRRNRGPASDAPH
ncbi:glycosyltransferase family 2 protein [Methylomagnum sp.]